MRKKKWVAGLSGGADSVFMTLKMVSQGRDLVAGHLNHAARGPKSDADQRFVERLGKRLGIPLVSGKLRESPAGERRPSAGTMRGAGTEARMRDSRYRFLESVRKRVGADGILVAHTADDQVETVLMRLFEGAGIAGLKGIPRATRGGIERPILDVWRKDIIKYLRGKKIPYRIDRSNFDTRYERNWIRHVLIPLLERRYGKSVKERIFALGERFREIDRFLETAARKWIGRNVRGEPGEATTAFAFRRERYGKLPSELRIRILQLLCVGKAGRSPNERLLASMDRLLLKGGSSARLNVGNGSVLKCRYDDALLLAPPGEPVKGAVREEAGRRGPMPGLVAEEKGPLAPGRLRILCRGERAAAFDADRIGTPFSVRASRPGDRIRPFGAGAGKKLKEVFIDRKVPREARWGRPVVCDASGEIVWVPGVVRSDRAPVTPHTLRAVVVRLAAAGGGRLPAGGGEPGASPPPDSGETGTRSRVKMRPGNADLPDRILKSGPAGRNRTVTRRPRRND